MRRPSKDGVPAETSAQLHDLVESHSRGTTPKASASGVAGSGATEFSTADESKSREPDLDRDLEAYLQTIAHEKEGASSKGQAGGSDSESAADLDDYLNELNDESEREASDEEDAVDVEKFIKNSEEGTIRY